MKQCKLFSENSKLYTMGLSRGAVLNYYETDWLGYGTGKDGAVTISSDTVYTQEIQATDFVLNAGVTLSTTRLTPIVIKATNSITINGTISADGMGYTYQEMWNFFNLAQSTQNVAGSIGISGGGSSGNAGRAPRGGQPVPVATMQTVLAQRYVPMLVYGMYTFPVFGGGGGTADLGALATYSTGGGCILMSAPTIIHNGHLTSRGLPGGGRSWNGDGGGGGGLIALFSRTLTGSGTYEACGGGGGGGAWGAVGTDGSWQNGGASTGRGYTRGGAGGGSTALNADGGTPGAGGSGSQFTGDAGNIEGSGGAGGNETGKDRGGRGGSGGGAGKIVWLKINR